jgi:methionine-rich copper-binding protein CopC
VALAAGAALVAVGAAAAPASAHIRLLLTTPAAGERLSAAPSSVSLRFDDTVISLGTAIRVTGPEGVVSTGAPLVDGRAVTQRLVPDAPPGGYEVAWRITSADGHPVSGRFRFEIEDPNAPTTSAAPSVTAGAVPPAAGEHVGHPQREGLLSSLSPGWVLLVVGGLGVGGLGVAGLHRSRRPRGLQEPPQEPAAAAPR